MLFKQSISSSQLALIVTTSLFLTTFPVIGITTIMATAIGLKYKMNLPLLIFITYMLEPLRFLLFIPLTEIGAAVLGKESQLAEMLTLQNSFDDFFYFLIHHLLYALTGWFLVILFTILPFYFVLKRLLKILFEKYQYIFSFKNA